MPALEDYLHPMVQAVCERSFDQLPESASLQYVRGNAGFNGFAKDRSTEKKLSGSPSSCDVSQRINGTNGAANS